MHLNNIFKCIFSFICLIFVKCQDIDLSFPADMMFGAASSAFQVEGAWNVSDKAESVWDHFSHTHAYLINNHSNADVSSDEYHKLKEDMQLAKSLGLNHYRFSISWSRLLPSGYPGVVSQDGLRYYHSILDELEKYNITPLVTIYHWDHPQSLEEFGGWLNEEMAFIYAEYTRIVFTEFGYRVKYFATLNEPQMFCDLGYETGTGPPGLLTDGTDKYRCLHNMLKGHALAYHLYDNTFRNNQNGNVGIIMQCQAFFNENKNDNTSDLIAFEFDCGWIANPIFSREGDYPLIMKERIAERSRLQGYRKSRLPEFSEYWIDYIRGSADFFGLNHYTSSLVSQLPKSDILSWPDDSGLEYTVDPKWASSGSSWLKVAPEGMGYILKKIKERYNNPNLYITENGVSDTNGTDDNDKINYLYSYMKEMLMAYKKHGCNIKAYTVWSLFDSFEFASGFKDKFGIIQVDFNDDNRKRTPKKSSQWYKKSIANRKLIDPDDMD